MHSPAAQAVVSRAGVILQANSAYAQLLGLDRGQLAGRKLAELERSHSPSALEAYLEQASVARSAPFEIRQHGAQGDEILLQLSALPLPDGANLLVSLRDVRLECRLKAENDRIHSLAEEIMDQAHLAVWEYDEADETFLFSERFFALLATTADREGGTRMPRAEFSRRFLLPDDDRLLSDELTRARSGGYDQRSLEQQIRRRDGVLIHTVVRMRVRRSAAGEFVGLQGSLQDVTEQRLADIYLRNSEEKFNAFMNALPHPAFIKDEKGRNIFMNPAMRTMLRLSGKELLGMANGVYLNAEDAAAIGRDDERLCRTRQPETVRQHITVGGKTRDLLTCKFPIIRDGESPVYGGVIQDVTEHLQLEAQARNYFLELEDLYNRAPCGYHSVDADGLIVRINDTELEWLGCRREDVVGKMKSFDFLTEKSHQVYQEIFPRLKAGEAIRGFILEVRRRNGSVMWWSVNASSIRDASGRFLMSRTSAYDVTETVRLQEASRESERHYRTLVGAMAEGLVVQAADGRIVDCNEQAEALLGKSRAQLMGRTLVDPHWRTIHRDGTPFPGEEHPAMVALHTAKAVRNVIVGVGRARSQARWLLVNANPLIAGPGEQAPYAVIATFSDITEHIAEQEQLELLLAQSKQDARTKSELLQEINHRVANSLTSVLGMLLLETEHVTSPDAAAARPPLERLALRIRGLLQVHRMLSQSGWAPVSLARLAHDIVGNVLGLGPQGLPPRIEVIAGDLRLSPRQASNVALVLNELATNSLKYATAPHPLAIRIAASHQGEFLEIIYQDNGPGYPRAVLDERKYNIGLSLVESIIEGSLQGSVSFANEDGGVARLLLRREPDTQA